MPELSGLATAYFFESFFGGIVFYFSNKLYLLFLINTNTIIIDSLKIKLELSLLATKYIQTH